jgi:aspartyl-tRNA(Asn)/glutamyl-tRNA(Gln) amidotransferase subunit A
LSHIGPITRDVGDAALMLETMSGPHPGDPSSHPNEFRAALADVSCLQGLRIAFSPTLGHAHVDPAVASVVAKAVLTFAELRASVEQVDPPWGPEGPAIIKPLWLAAQWALRPRDPSALASVDPALVACLEEAAGLTIEELIGAQGRRLAYAGAVGRWFAGGWDLLVTPSASVQAFEVGRVRPAHWPTHPWNWLAWAEFCYPFNLAHTPAISVPCGMTEEGLPVGLQIVGSRHSDNSVLQAAAAFLTARPFDWARGGQI